jgi:hypothetical protein
VKSSILLEHERGSGEAGSMTKTLTRARHEAPVPGIPLTSPAGELIRRQQGVLSAAQAAAHGLAHETLRQRVLRGIWQRLLPGVYVLQCGPPTRRQWLIAALVYAGDGSMLTGSAALAELPLPEPATSTTPEFPAPAGETAAPLNLSVPPIAPATLPRPPVFAPSTIDVLVPHRTRRQNVPGTSDTPAVRVLRATRPPTPIASGPLRLAPAARAVIDACFSAASRGETNAVEAIADQVLATGRAGLAELEAELARAPRRHSSHLRAHLARRREETRAAAAMRLAAAAESLGCGGHGHGHGPEPGRSLGRDRPLRDVAVYAGRRPVARAAALWPARAVAAAVDAAPHELESLERLGFAVIPVAPQHVAGDLPGLLNRISRVLKDRPEATLPAGVSMVVDVSSRRPRLSVS